MSGPARAGLIIYALNRKLLVDFYCTVFTMHVLHQSDDLHVLSSNDIQIIIHDVPEYLQPNDKVNLSVEPKVSTLKFFLSTNNMIEAEQKIIEMGGGVLSETWQTPLFTVKNAFDSEGNVFHLREFV
ncbi:VOC family protein [Sessilibacter sp. MAH2]